MRANATLLFTEAFPVHDPDQNNKNIDEDIQKQLDTTMVNLLNHSKSFCGSFKELKR